MKNYDIQSEMLSFGGSVKAFEAQKTNGGGRVVVVRFPQTENAGHIFRPAGRFAMSLNDRALLPVVDLFDDTENGGGFCVAYQWNHSLTPIADIAPEVRGPWIMRDSARILNDLYRRNLYGQFIGKQAIFVDEENYSVHLAFIGLADAFRTCEAGPWHNGAMPNKKDDVHHLAKCFEEEIKDASDVVRSCLAEDKKDRPDYPQLLREMSASPLFHPHYAATIYLMSKNARTLSEHLNTTDCYVSPWQEEEHNGKIQRKCKFFTEKYYGKFVSEKDARHFFVPLVNPNLSNKLSAGKILRTRFCATITSPDRQEGYHHLANLGDQKTKAIEKWRVVPEQEKKYIEATAFNARYYHVRKISESVMKFSFLVSPEDVDWQKIQSLKERQKKLDAAPMKVRKTKNSNGMNVGKVDDMTEERLVVNVKIKKDHTHKESGQLIIGGTAFQYAFCWRFGGSLSFAAEINGAKDLHKQLKEMLGQADPVSVSFSGTFTPFGNLQKVDMLREIITRDPSAEFNEIPGSGNLLEDVFMETLPFKRQIEAVDSFERKDIVEPALCGILATPQEHKPLILTVPRKVFGKDTPETSEKFREGEESGKSASSSYLVNEKPTPPPLFDKKLNRSQQSAVTHALLQKPLFLVQGPPGTGKTTVIVEIVRQILEAKPNARILVCSQTNLAVDNVLERLPSKREKGHTPIRKVRLASDASQSKIHREVRKDLVSKKIHQWSKDTINLSEKTQQKISQHGEMSERERAIAGVVKEWQAMLRDPTNKNCQMRDNAGGEWLSMETAYLKSMNVLGATCVHIASSKYRDIFSDTFDCLIIDEAGKATPAEALIPIALAKHVVLIGDHKQLPPFVTRERGVLENVREKMEDEGIEDLSKEFGESLFESLISTEKLKPCQIMLNEQRRMPKQIGDLISKYFYDGKLESPADEEYAHKKRIDLPLKNNTSIVFIDTAGRKDPHDNDRVTSRQNRCNVNVVMETLGCLNKRLKKARTNNNKIDVAIIAGYKGQVELLQKRVKGERFSRLKNVDVNTVDGFQGRESTVVIYDTVRSSSGNASIGFLDDPRRLNVALSRAQKLLIIIGNADYLLNRAKPMTKLNPKKENAEMPILGEITKEIMEQNGVFKSLEEALE